MDANPLDHERLLLADYRALRALARSLLGSKDDAEDVVQGAYVAAQETAAPVRALLRPWLLVTVRNLAAMLRRSEARRSARERAAAKDELQAGSDPAAIAVQAELIADIGVAVQQLEEPFRTTIVLRFWRGLLPEAIAAELQVPRNTVRSRLQRGLERLRARLDAKYGKRERWSVPLLTVAGVREGTAVAASGASLVMVGLLMKTKLLVGAVAVVVAALAMSLFWSPGNAADTPASAPGMSPMQLVASAERPASSNQLERQTVDLPRAQSEAPATEEPFDPSPVHVEPWTSNLLVVDEGEEPIAGATITIWAVKKVERSADLRKSVGGPRHAYANHEDLPREQVQTDANGRVRVVLDLECYTVAARKEGVGETGEETLWHTRTVELKLVLPAESVAAGTVTRADGTPAAGAMVTADPASMPTPQVAPEPVLADADGRFSICLHGRGNWIFRARLGSEHSLCTPASVVDDHPPAVRIAFPGAITLTGTVVDAEGRPVAKADVRAWREYHLRDPEQDVNDFEAVSGEADQEGRFTIAVQRFARYQLLASAKGHATSRLVWAETTPVRPHSETRLDLQRFTTIRGRVVHDDDSPFAGVKIYARAESGEETHYSAVPSRDDLFPGVSPATTADDGNFALTVHGGTTWTIMSRPLVDNASLGTRLEGIAPGNDDVLMRITADDLTGCVVRGTIVTASDGKPVENCGVEVVAVGRGGRQLTGGVKVLVEGNHFELAPLPLGHSYGLRVTPRFGPGGLPTLLGPLAPANVDPFVTQKDGVVLEVRVDAWGELPVRVVAADGLPARSVAIGSWPVAPQGFGQLTQHVDGEGRTVLPQRMPGVHRLLLFAGGDKPLLEQHVTILPGLNPEITVRLPAKPAVRTK